MGLWSYVKLKVEKTNCNMNVLTQFFINKVYRKTDGNSMCSITLNILQRSIAAMLSVFLFVFVVIVFKMNFNHKNSSDNIV